MTPEKVLVVYCGRCAHKQTCWRPCIWVLTKLLLDKEKKEIL